MVDTCAADRARGAGNLSDAAPTFVPQPPRRRNTECLFSVTLSGLNARRQAFQPAVAEVPALALGRRLRNPRQSLTGFVPENQVRTRLPAGGKRIRTLGPSRKGVGLPRGRELVRESVHLGATRDRSRGVICVCAVGVAC